MCFWAFSLRVKPGRHAAFTAWMNILKAALLKVPKIHLHACESSLRPVQEAGARSVKSTEKQLLSSLCLFCAAGDLNSSVPSLSSFNAVDIQYMLSVDINSSFPAWGAITMATVEALHADMARLGFQVRIF